MKARSPFVVALVLAVLAWFAHQFRYEVVALNNPLIPGVYRLDRWTGKIEIVARPAGLPVVLDLEGSHGTP